MKNDDAIAPVVAVMMILVVVVTLLGIWNAIYLPGFKQQAEVEHLRDVENGMVRFSADIDNSIFLWRNGTMSESIPLGGGDILLNSIRSGGGIRINQRESATNVIDVDGIPSAYGFLSNITYEPVSNFWLNQGYSWEEGTINVSRGPVSVPISLENQYLEARDAFRKNLLKQPEYSNDYHNITIKIVNITPHSLNSASSGNGNSQLKLNATVVRLPEWSGVTNLTVNGLPPSDLKYPANVTIERLDIILSAE
ncbi:MAG TPA: hypothetical protein PLN56_04150 [Methanoregulaceae archaeon]|nr:MAG: hypothetical protein IPI71_08155 [Methanolinea sp.]HON81221.1 hypothetical protein [Methanoregulaceae archaeon]HPD10174.1 hypothetical protein [Methanoregulaceae archaeon]HRT15179.1 hypothetical protein [Methanoregulaceae archaeon]HRU30704.1 hypothetical protein [Methanoregulaceae archaeon]